MSDTADVLIFIRIITASSRITALPACISELSYGPKSTFTSTSKRFANPF